MEVEALKVEMRSSYGINLIEVITTRPSPGPPSPLPPHPHIHLPTPSDPTTRPRTRLRDLIKFHISTCFIRTKLATLCRLLKMRMPSKESYLETQVRPACSPAFIATTNPVCMHSDFALIFRCALLTIEAPSLAYCTTISLLGGVSCLPRRAWTESAHGCLCWADLKRALLSRIHDRYSWNAIVLNKVQRCSYSPPRPSPNSDGRGASHCPGIIDANDASRLATFHFLHGSTGYGRVRYQRKGTRACDWPQ